MASFLYPCTNGCGRQVRFTRPQTKPVVCDDCVAAIAANKRSTRAAARQELNRRRKEGEWIHKGGGNYVHSTTGEKRRGRPV